MGCFGSGRLEVDQGFVQPDLEDARDDVLASLVTDLTAQLKPADLYLARRSRQDLERHLPTVVAGEILVVVVGRSGESPLHQHRVDATALGTRSLLNLLARQSLAPPSQTRLDFYQ